MLRTKSVISPIQLPATLYAEVQEIRKVIADIQDALDSIEYGMSDALIGKQGENGKDGRDGRDGKDGRDGLDGIMGRDGKDGQDGAVGKRGPKGMDGKDGVDGKDAATPEVATLMEAFIQELEKDGLSLKELKKIESRFSEIRNQVATSDHNKKKGGGGDTVSAGTNITITTTSDGTKRINTTSGSGTQVTTQYQLLAVQSGTDVTIDLTQLTNYATFGGIVMVYRNNVPQTLTLDFTFANPILTVKNADAGEVFNLSYSFT